MEKSFKTKTKTFTWLFEPKLQIDTQKLYKAIKNYSEKCFFLTEHRVLVNYEFMAFADAAFTVWSAYLQTYTD